MAYRDVNQAITELRGRFLPFSGKSTDASDISDYVKVALERFVKPWIKPKSKERFQPSLFPPGSCIHFYRDGFGISGCYSPCTFFDQIDVSRTMLSDHSISTGYRRIFLELMRDYMNNQHFKFEEKENDRR